MNEDFHDEETLCYSDGKTAVGQVCTDVRLVVWTEHFGGRCRHVRAEEDNSQFVRGTVRRAARQELPRRGTDTQQEGEAHQCRVRCE